MEYLAGVHVFIIYHFDVVGGTRSAFCNIYFNPCSHLLAILVILTYNSLKDINLIVTLVLVLIDLS